MLLVHENQLILANNNDDDNNKVAFSFDFLFRRKCKFYF